MRTSVRLGLPFTCWRAILKEEWGHRLPAYMVRWLLHAAAIASGLVDLGCTSGSARPEKRPAPAWQEGTALHCARGRRRRFDAFLHRLTLFGHVVDVLRCRNHVRISAMHTESPLSVQSSQLGNSGQLTRQATGNQERPPLLHTKPLQIKTDHKNQLFNRSDSPALIHHF